MKDRRLIIMALLSLAALAGIVCGQPPEDSFHSPHGGKGMHRMVGDFENLRLLKLLEVLELSDAQSEKFIPIFHKYRQKMREVRKERNNLLDTLLICIQEKKGEKEMERFFDLLNINERTQKEQEVSLNNEISGILDIYQKAKLFLFKESFEREVLQSLREFRGQEKYDQNDKDRDNRTERSSP